MSERKVYITVVQGEHDTGRVRESLSAAASNISECLAGTIVATAFEANGKTQVVATLDISVDSEGDDDQ